MRDKLLKATGVSVGKQAQFNAGEPDPKQMLNTANSIIFQGDWWISRTLDVAPFMIGPR
jgi:hypothetical protein